MIAEKSVKLTVKGVAENRIAPFIMYLMIGLPIYTPKVLNCIPKAAIYGILAFVGVAGLLDTQLWQRCVGLLQAPSSFPTKFRSVPWNHVHAWTAIQLIILAVAWGVNLTPAGLLFSLIIVLIVPFRAYCVPRIFAACLGSDEDVQKVLEVLDSAHEGNEDVDEGEEQMGAAS